MNKISLLLMLVLISISIPTFAATTDKWEVCDMLNISGPECDTWWINITGTNITVNDYTIIEDFDCDDWTNLSDYYTKSDANTKFGEYLLLVDKFDTATLDSYVKYSDMNSSIRLRINDSITSGEINETLSLVGDDTLGVDYIWWIVINTFLLLCFIAMAVKQKMDE